MSWDFGWRGAGFSRCDLPKMYEKYCRPYARKIVRALESDDFFVSYHICGDTRESSIAWCQREPAYWNSTISAISRSSRRRRRNNNASWSDRSKRSHASRFR